MKHIENGNWTRRQFLSASAKGAAALAVGSSLLLRQKAAWAADGIRYQDSRTTRAAGGTRGVVVSISEQASAEGIKVLNAGGNAIDAAVAVLFAMGVVRPDLAGLGGDGHAVVRMADGRIGALDFRCRAPAKLTSDELNEDGMHLEASAGHRVIGVPGVVAGADALLEKFGSGRFSLGELIKPAEDLASNGIVVTKDLAAFAILQKPRLSYYRETARVYGGLDTYYRAGLRYPLPDYANSLKLIRLYGPTAFYKDRSYPEGEGIANRIVADSKRAEEDGATDPLLLAWFQGNAHDKGYLELEDFKTYEAVWRTPVTGTYRGHEIITMPPPSGGGVVVMEMLNILEEFPLGSTKLDRADTDNSWAQSSANHLHYLAEAQKLAYGDRRAAIADPDLHPEVAANAARLASKSYGQIRATQIEKDKASAYPAGEAASHTNHFSIIDQWGNAIAVTNSQGNPFGSGVTVPGTGLLMTDQLSDWLFRVPSEADVAFLDQPLPRARPMTSQTPTIVVRNGLPVLVTGGAGGPQIPMGVVETILNTIHFPDPVHPLDPPSEDYGEHLLRALDAERIDAVAKGGRSTDPAKKPYELVIEDPPDDGSRGPGRPPNYPERDELGRTSRFPDFVEEALKDRGHAIRRVTLANDSELETGYDGAPWIEAAGIGPTGMRFAASDPRHEAHGAIGQE